VVGFCTTLNAVDEDVALGWSTEVKYLVKGTGSWSRMVVFVLT